MGDFEGLPKKKNHALMLWSATVAILIGPAILVWIIRAVGYVESCAPGPALCHGMPLGFGLRDALALAWALPTNTMLMITVAVAATIAGLFARRPLLAAGGLLILPVAALALPMLAVASAKYDGCSVDESGVGDCMLWGANMGMSFHTAAQAPGLVFDFFPYSFALALMLGLLGWFFSQPRPARSRAHAMARMKRMDHR
jgi:hypothetical protein